MSLLENPLKRKQYNIKRKQYNVKGEPMINPDDYITPRAKLYAQVFREIEIKKERRNTMRCVGIELNLLEMLEGETVNNPKFDPDEWSQNDIDILRRVANFVEREQNDRKESELSAKNLQ